uniref:Uncharacterized protein n=1 Tax=Panagrolaimus sp. ES5 TaxID=591445 RepID=A0AC34GFU2_9BILA
MLPHENESSKRFDQCDNIQDNLYDRRIPLHSDLAYQHGILFEAKYIRSMEINRPTLLIEIVAAMWRFRYEFKERNIKKKPVDIVVSVEGVKVVLKQEKNEQKEQSLGESKRLVMFHPICK